MRRNRPIRLATAAFALLGLLAAACGSDDAGDTTAAASPAAADDTTDTTETARAAPELTGDPVMVGFINNEGGAAFSVPELGIGAEVGAGYVNAELGGINGGPIELVPCKTDGSPEKSIDCANKLIEDGVVAILEGTGLGADAELGDREGGAAFVVDEADLDRVTGQLGRSPGGGGVGGVVGGGRAGRGGGVPRVVGPAGGEEAEQRNRCGGQANGTVATHGASSPLWNANDGSATQASARTPAAGSRGRPT